MVRCWLLVVAGGSYQVLMRTFVPHERLQVPLHSSLQHRSGSSKQEFRQRSTPVALSSANPRNCPARSATAAQTGSNSFPTGSAQPDTFILRVKAGRNGKGASSVGRNVTLEADNARTFSRRGESRRWLCAPAKGFFPQRFPELNKRGWRNTRGCRHVEQLQHTHRPS